MINNLEFWRASNVGSHLSGRSNVSRSTVLNHKFTCLLSFLSIWWIQWGGEALKFKCCYREKMIFTKYVLLAHECNGSVWQVIFRWTFMYAWNVLSAKYSNPLPQTTVFMISVRNVIFQFLYLSCISELCERFCFMMSVCCHAKVTSDNIIYKSFDKFPKNFSSYYYHNML